MYGPHASKLYINFCLTALVVSDVAPRHVSLTVWALSRTFVSTHTITRWTEPWQESNVS